MGVIKLSKRHELSDVGPGDFVNGTGVPLCVLCILGLQLLEPLCCRNWKPSEEPLIRLLKVLNFIFG